MSETFGWGEEINDIQESYGEHLPDGFEKEWEVFSYVVQASWWIENLLNIASVLRAYNKLSQQEMADLRKFLVSTTADTDIYPWNVIRLTVSNEGTWIPSIDWIPLSN